MVVCATCSVCVLGCVFAALLMFSLVCLCFARVVCPSTERNVNITTYKCILLLLQHIASINISKIKYRM